jgi:hypothetical protein
MVALARHSAATACMALVIFSCDDAELRFEIESPQRLSAADMLCKQFVLKADMLPVSKLVGLGPLCLESLKQ